jgi:hypothetical protein
MRYWYSLLWLSVKILVILIILGSKSKLYVLYQNF